MNLKIIEALKEQLKSEIKKIRNKIQKILEDI